MINEFDPEMYSIWLCHVLGSACNEPGGGEGTQLFFLVGVCGPDFRNGGLWTDHCLWKRGLVNGKFPNLEACELKISKSGGLRAKTWAKIEVNFLFSKGRLVNWLLVEMGPLWTTGDWNGTLEETKCVETYLKYVQIFQHACVSLK